MQVRLALESDIDEVVAMAKENIETTRPDMEWDEDLCRASFWSYIAHASPTIWVVEHNDTAIGFLLADMYSYRAAKGIFVTQEVLFVKPAYRGGRASILLTKELIGWAEMLGAREIVGGNDNQFNSERTAKFLSKFGFEKVGYSMIRKMQNGRQE